MIKITRVFTPKFLGRGSRRPIFLHGPSRRSEIQGDQVGAIPGASQEPARTWRVLITLSGRASEVGFFRHVRGGMMDGLPRHKSDVSVCGLINFVTRRGD